MSHPTYATAFVYYVSLRNRADNGKFIASPTIATGDFKIAKDDGPPANLATLPAVDGDFTTRVKVALSSTEMTAGQVSIIAIDLAGNQWEDQHWDIHIEQLMVQPGQVLAPEQVTPTVAQSWLYKWFANPKENDGTNTKLKNYADSQVDQKTTTTVAAGVASESKWVAGP